MNLDIIQSTKEGEITQFLCDVRDYFKASLTTSEYENTSNMFYVTASETTEKLLNRCEGLINRLNIKSQKGPTDKSTSEYISDSTLATTESSYKENAGLKRIELKTELEDVSYLEMSAATYKRSPIKFSNNDRVENDLKNSGGHNKTIRCSKVVVEQNKSFLFERHNTMTTTVTTAKTPTITTIDDKSELKDEPKHEHDSQLDNNLQIYDICQIKFQSSDDEDIEIGNGKRENVETLNSTYCSLPHIDCPYMDLPAGHLSIYKSTKYGQLQKIEKRLFFDQSKKCYCGILNDWLLCYMNGPTSSRPSISVYLKMPSIEVEHYGEGKRRDVCFQISTCDSNKKFIFQAINEIDAKEWIHAVETAIRSDINSLDVKNSLTRKLPTPPVAKKITFLSSFQKNYELSSTSTANDSIYEEPSPIQQSRDLIKSSSEHPPQLPSKLQVPSMMNSGFEYDVPKCPAKPLENFKNVNEANQSEPSNLQYDQQLHVNAGENLNFRAIVKDVHNKLSSQLTSASNPKKPLKKSVTSSLKSNCDISGDACNFGSSPVIEMKKQKKLTPNTSPQKVSSEKTSLSKNWLLNKINKANSSTRSNSSSPSNSPSKCKQSEKENLLNSTCDACDSYATTDIHLGSNPASPMLETNQSKNGGGKVNKIINQLEASGHLVSIFSTDTVAAVNPFCGNDYSNYEPIMTVSKPPYSIKKS